jgi:hypothetical protein
MKTDHKSGNRTLTKASLVVLAGLSQSALAVDWYVSGFIRQEGLTALIVVTRILGTSREMFITALRRRTPLNNF